MQSYSVHMAKAQWPFLHSASSVASCVKYQVIWYPDNISMCPAGEHKVTTVGLKTHRDHLVRWKSRVRKRVRAEFEASNHKAPEAIKC